MEKDSWIEWILRRRALTHGLWWLFLLLFYPLYAGILGASPAQTFPAKLVYLPGQMCAAYLLIYVQIPRLIYARRYGAFLLSLAVSLPAFAALAHFLDDYVLARIAESHPPHALVEILREPYNPYYLFTAYLIPLIMSGVKLVKQRLEEQGALEQLEKEKVRAELQWLKAQIHPRFLFNTLDYLYDLTLEESDAAPDVVVKLSDMLDYMLYEGNAPRVPATREAEGVRRYMELEAGRYGERLNWAYDVEIVDPSVEVAPLIVLSLVEKAFKYGVPLDMAGPVIRVSLRVETGRLRLDILTGRPWLDEGENDMAAGKTEAFDNIRRRLALTYPGRHALSEKKTEGIYKLQLLLEPD